jgi:hypothetical protein
MQSLHQVADIFPHTFDLRQIVVVIYATAQLYNFIAGICSRSVTGIIIRIT